MKRLEAKVRVYLGRGYFWLISHEVCLCKFGLSRLCAAIGDWLLP